MSDREWLNRIREIVEDENRIVTYKILSKECKVSVNEAKSILQTFVKEEQSKKCDELEVCYCVAGVKCLNLGDSERQVNVVCIVPDKKLDNVKSNLKVVSSEHVYSVQRSGQDSCSLYTTDLDARDERHLSSGVKCDRIRPRNAHPKGGQPEIEICSKKSSSSKDDFASRNYSAEDTTDVAHKDANFVTKKTIVAKLNKNNSKGNSKENKTTLANMFANQAAKENPNNTKEKENVKESECKTSSISHADDKKESKGASEKEKSVIETKAPNKRPTTRGRKNVRSKSKTKTKEVPAKRRRILVSDSSSSEPEEEEDPLADMDIEEPEDPVPPRVRSPSLDNHRQLQINDSDEMEVANSPFNNTPGIIRQKKLVSKTFLDEDGYLVTKKVTEIVEHVEEPLPVTKESAKSLEVGGKRENSVETKKVAASSKAKKPSPPKTSKQASLMSFFKRA